MLTKAADGLEVTTSCSCRRTSSPGEQRPAIVFVHGGPARQMLLGYHYMHFYHWAYGINQWLANQGYVVLSVNYRSGIGYGRSFRHAPNTGGSGNAEYQDVLAGGKYLQSRPDVDPDRVGIWGLSYGGVLTAQALARNSDIFKAGVDLAGVHLWGSSLDPDAVSFKSSAIGAIDGWKSPVLLVHGDDDRNVAFQQTTGLVQLLRAARRLLRADRVPGRHARVDAAQPLAVHARPDGRLLPALPGWWRKDHDVPGGTVSGLRMFSPSLPPPILVADEDSLGRLVRALASCPVVAVDTESNSLHAYRERVCLIQFSTPAADYIVDPIRLPDLSPLAPFFANPDQQKVFHAAEYDLICLRRDYQFEFTNIFDTMSAARTLGWPQVGLAAILDTHFGVKMNKKYQRADWKRRPLTPEQLDYARLDTHYLVALRDRQLQALTESGRWPEAHEEFERLARPARRRRTTRARTRRRSGASRVRATSRPGRPRSSRRCSRTANSRPSGWTALPSRSWERRRCWSSPAAPRAAPKICRACPA